MTVFAQWSGVKNPDELHLILNTIHQAGRSTVNQDAIHVLNIYLLMSRYEQQTIAARQRAAKSIDNLLEQITDGTLIQSIKSDIACMQRTNAELGL